MALSKADLKGRAPRTKEVETELGTFVIRELMASELTGIGKLTKAGKEEEVGVTLIQHSVLNEDGTQMFGGADRADILNLPASVFITLVNEVDVFNKPPEKKA